MSEDKKDQSKLRQNRNQDVLRKMKAGESLSSFDSMQSWYPERPPIEKDQEILKRLFGNQPKANGTLQRKAPARDLERSANEPRPMPIKEFSNDKKSLDTPTSSQVLMDANVTSCPVVQINQRRRIPDDSKTR